jgi:ribosomal protein L37AE/L43A
MRGDESSCPYCSKQFVKRNEQHKYCSESCRVRAHREVAFTQAEDALAAAQSSIDTAREAIRRLRGVRK